MKVIPSKKPSYWSFGYIPTGRLRDIVRRRYGFPNLAKRVQAPAIIKALALDENEQCCDLGCGTGYFTIELAKLCRRAIGVDINPEIASMRIPDFLRDKLRFVVQDARELPVASGSIDVVLCSEVLMMIKDPSQFLNEVKRVLKPGGRIVAVNGLGHNHIRDAYTRNSWGLKVVQNWLGSRVPKNYDDYYEQLQKNFGTALQPQSQMFYPRLLESAGFVVNEISYSPSEISARYISWLQFIQFSRTGKGVTKFTYARFLIASVLNLIGGQGRSNGQIVCARLGTVESNRK